MAKKPTRPGAPLPGYDMFAGQSLSAPAQPPLQEDFDPSEMALPPEFPRPQAAPPMGMPQPMGTPQPQGFPQPMGMPQAAPQMQAAFPPQPPGFPSAETANRQVRSLPTPPRPQAVPANPTAVPPIPSFTQPMQPGFAMPSMDPGLAENPLLAFTRMPGMHIKLPSQGAYMPPGSLRLTATGELPVYPMRAADEVLMKNPDALMSGLAVEQLILSCVPGISNPQTISMPDLDVLLLAIRAASYGEQMEFEVKCPKCGEENAFDAHLPSLLGNVTELPVSCPVPLTEGVTAYMRPYALRNATQVAVISFEETRRIQSAEGKPDDERAQIVSVSLKRITALTEMMLKDCVMCVEIPTGQVTDPTHIGQFLSNIPRSWTKRMEDALKDLNSHGLSKKIQPVCSKCAHEWETELEFDPSSFFGQGS